MTGTTLRATVERALRELVSSSDDALAARRRRSQIDVGVLLSDEAWR